MEIYERKAYYHETDQMGVIHHANYLKWMEEARIKIFDSIGVSYRHLEETGIISPVVSININYKYPAKFDDDMVVELEVLRYTGIRYEIGYTIKNKETGKVCVTAESSHCFLKDGNIISIKREYPEYHQMIMDYMAK